MTPDPMRATAEADTERELRRMRECEEYIRSFHWNPETPEEVRDLVIGNVRAAWNRGGEARESEMTHRDRTAEREAVEKFVAAYCADDELNLQRFLTHYLAAEFDAGERTECERCGGLMPAHERQYSSHLELAACVNFLAATIKRLAEQRGAER